MTLCIFSTDSLKTEVVVDPQGTRTTLLPTLGKVQREAKLGRTDI